MTQELMNIEECCLMEFHARLMMHSFHLERFQQANKRGNFSAIEVVETFLTRKAEID